MDWIFSNGLRASFRAVDDRGLAAITVAYALGSRSEPIEGLAHLCEHLLFEGSANILRGEHVRLVARLRGQTNAFTAADTVCLWTVCPVEAIEAVIALEADRLGGVVASDESVARQQAILRQEVLNSKAQRAPGACEARPGDVRQFLALFGPSIAAIAVVGPRHVAETAYAAMRRHLSGIPESVGKRVPYCVDATQQPLPLDRSVGRTLHLWLSAPNPVLDDAAHIEAMIALRGFERVAWGGARRHRGSSIVAVSARLRDGFSRWAGCAPSFAELVMYSSIDICGTEALDAVRSMSADCEASDFIQAAADLRSHIQQIRSDPLLLSQVVAARSVLGYPSLNLALEQTRQSIEHARCASALARLFSQSQVVACMVDP